MSKIHSLIIQGIRSFDEKNPEKIKFFSPLTLIVGYNGSGKTTIIECLKFAATGDQPPNSKGGAFIHDPQLCNEKDVKAQVKLLFKSTTAAAMVVTRSLELSVQRGGARKMRTLENSLHINRAGEPITVSQRNVEINQIIPQYLGVSKAVLDNVVFCHQDESLWPLSEPGKLKDKFDEIFEVEQYTKAIENLKVLKKKQGEELAQLKVTEKHEKENKDRGEKAEKRSIQLQDDIESLEQRADEMKRQRDDAHVKATDAWDKAAQYENIKSKLDGKRIAAQGKEDSIQDIKSDIKELQESDESLQSMLNQYDQRAKSYQTDIQAKQEQYTLLDQQISENQEALGAKQNEQGQYQAEKSHYERQIQDRETIVKDIARQQNIRGFDYGLNDARIREFMDRVATMARDQRAVLESAREESKTEISEAQQALNKLKEQKYSLSQNKEYADEQISTNDAKIVEYDRSVQNFSVDDGAKAYLESNVQSLQQTLQNLKSNAENANWDAKVQGSEQKLQSLEEKKEKLDAEIVEATKDAKETAELDHLHKRLKDSETGLDTILGAHAERLTNVIGPSWRSRDIENAYQRVSDAKSAETKDAQSKADQLGFQLNQVNYRITKNKEDTKAKSERRRHYENAIQEAISERTLTQYHDVVRELEQDVNTRKRDLELCKWYVQCQETLKQYRCCRLCMRHFETSNEYDKFEAALRKKTEDIDTKEMAQELEQAEHDLGQLRSLAPSYDNWQILTKTELPALKSELTLLEAEHTSIISQAENADRQVKELEAAKRDIDVVAQNIKQIVKYQNDIELCKEQIKMLSQKSSNLANSRGLEVIYDDSRAVTEQIKSAQKELSGLRNERENSRTKINNMEIEVRDMNEKLKEAISQIKERESVNAQRAELVELNKRQRRKISDIDEKLRQVEPQISQHQARCDDLERRAQDKYDQLQREEASITANLDKLKIAQRDINSYIERGGPEQLQRVEREIKTNQVEQKELLNQRTELVKDINKLKQQASSHGETRRNIERNLKYRKEKQALSGLLTDISNLESQYVAADQAQYTEEAKKWEMQRTACNAEASSLMGEAKSKDDELKVLLEDWNTDYKDVKYRYREANVKVQTTEAAIEDLDRYSKALDNAIMEFHSLKMDEINTVVDELWRKTYQGTDVDTIIIRSDNDNPKSKKSYNYRVCMVKQEAEMDMRGRCSAGQRVLASIIIRLALAECFGVACGLIALDEPTTNLDSDNIQALAVALHDLIKMREQQSNFQLIVITHDEDFLKFMRCQEFCESYYRISRSENQKSEIEIQSLARVM